MTVTTGTLSAATQGPTFGPAFYTYDGADSNVHSVTIFVGANNTIAATGLESHAIISIGNCHDCFPGASAWSTVATVSVNGRGISYGAQPTAVPVPGVGTLHINWNNLGGPGFPPAMSRALWLEGSPGIPDVIVAEAKVCDPIFLGCP
jgi:hypothetical protein